jgi:hypothetical protein
MCNALLWGATNPSIDLGIGFRYSDPWLLLLLLLLLSHATPHTPQVPQPGIHPTPHHPRHRILFPPICHGSARQGLLIQL